MLKIALIPTLIVLILAVCATPARAVFDPCPHAPDPRLHEGDEAIVSPRIQRLNLRSLPAVETGVEQVLNPGTPVTVLSGPSCNGSYNWWRVETANGRRGWVAEGTWDEYYVLPARDADRVINPLEWTCTARFSPPYCYLP